MSVRPSSSFGGCLLPSGRSLRLAFGGLCSAASVALLAGVEFKVPASKYRFPFSPRGGSSLVTGRCGKTKVLLFCLWWGQTEAYHIPELAWRVRPRPSCSSFSEMAPSLGFLCVPVPLPPQRHPRSVSLLKHLYVILSLEFCF